MWGKGCEVWRGRTKGVARPQPQGDKGAAMREGCCRCMGAIPENRELAKSRKKYVLHA